MSELNGSNNNVTTKANTGMRTITTGKLVAGGAACTVGGAAAGIGIFVAVRNLWSKHKEKKAKKEQEAKKDTTEKPAEPKQVE